MKNALYDHGYGAAWTDVYVETRERYRSSVTDFHEHDFYEINLILSGNVNVLTANQAVSGTACRMVLTRPNTSHFISCRSDTLYRSLYLVFSQHFIESCDADFVHLLRAFGDSGNICDLTGEQAARCAEIIHAIAKEKAAFRKKLLVYYLLSYVNDLQEQQSACVQRIPSYVTEALEYTNRHFAQGLTAQRIADAVHIGRTTLLLGFKKHTGKTLHEYLIYRRLHHAIRMLSQGANEYEAALASGFHDSSGLIQCFKRTLHMTPRQYMAHKGEE